MGGREPIYLPTYLVTPASAEEGGQRTRKKGDEWEEREEQPHGTVGLGVVGGKVALFWGFWVEEVGGFWGGEAGGSSRPRGGGRVEWMGRWRRQAQEPHPTNPSSGREEEEGEEDDAWMETPTNQPPNPPPTHPPTRLTWRKGAVHPKLMLFSTLVAKTKVRKGCRGFTGEDEVKVLADKEVGEDGRLAASSSSSSCKGRMAGRGMGTHTIVGAEECKAP